MYAEPMQNQNLGQHEAALADYDDAVKNQPKINRNLSFASMYKIRKKRLCWSNRGF